MLLSSSVIAVLPGKTRHIICYYLKQSFVSPSCIRRHYWNWAMESWEVIWHYATWICISLVKGSCQILEGIKECAVPPPQCYNKYLSCPYRYAMKMNWEAAFIVLRRSIAIEFIILGYWKKSINGKDNETRFQITKAPHIVVMMWKYCVYRR